MRIRTGIDRHGFSRLISYGGVWNLQRMRIPQRSFVPASSAWMAARTSAGSGVLRPAA